MTARVLVVDDITANIKLLEARLMAEYFEVSTATSGEAALQICNRERIDVVLLDVMMPGMDGFETCRRIKANKATQHVPVIMVTALDQTSDKVQGLEAGADDFLSKPVDDIALITRVKNLARLKFLNDEMQMRAATTQALGLPESTALARALRGESGRILLVDDHRRSAVRTMQAMTPVHDVFVDVDIQAALLRVAVHNFDLLMVSLNLASADGLRLCSQVRAFERTRHLPIIVIVDPNEDARLLRGLDMGVNDYLVRPIDRHEMLARVKTQIKRKRHADLLKNCLEESVEFAITDALTGLHNRRYMEGHLRTLVAESHAAGRPLSILVADIDHFKRINDTWGHDAGDHVLREFANRFRRNSRGVDLACRFGGEEFVTIMPETTMDRAYQVAERLRQCIAAEPFRLNSATQLPLTASVGLATVEHAGDTPESLFKRADKALYTAKREGRNKVVADAA